VNNHKNAFEDVGNFFYGPLFCSKEMVFVPDKSCSRVYTKTAHEPKRPRPKWPINFRYVQNGPWSKTVHKSCHTV